MARTAVIPCNLKAIALPERIERKVVNVPDSKETLAKALEGLMAEKPLDDIRIMEISGRAGVSKQTFYHHFADKYALMEYCARELFANPLATIGSIEPYSRGCRAYYEACHVHRKFMRNAFQSKDVNGLFRVMHHLLRDAYGKRVEAHGVTVDAEVGFALDFYSKGVAGCTRRWFDQGMDFSDEAMIRLVADCVPTSVANLFE